MSAAPSTPSHPANVPSGSGHPNEPSRPSATRPNDHKDKIHVAFVGGKARVLPTNQGEYLKPYLPHIKALGICCRPSLHEAFQRLFNHKLPALEDLCVMAERDEGNGIGTHQAPTYVLRGRNFPSLRKLAIRDALVNLDGPLCVGLRNLHLKMCRHTQCRLPLENFLETVRHCSGLETLAVERYVDAAFTPPKLGVYSLQRHRRLNHIKLADEPHALSKIFEHLFMPDASPGIDIETVVLVGRNTAQLSLRSIFPRDLCQLPILQNTAFIRVRDLPDVPPNLSGLNSTSFGARGLDLDIRALDGADDALEGRRDGRLFHSMIESLNIFDGSPVQEVQLCGNMKAVPQTSWVSALDRYYTIRQLELWDIPNAPEDSYDVLLAALAAPSMLRWGTVVCPDLETFHLAGTLRGTRLPLAIAHCLKQRTVKFGAQRPRELRLKLFPDCKWTADQERWCQGVLRDAADTVTLEIYSPDHDQTSTMCDEEDDYWRGTLKR